MLEVPARRRESVSVLPSRPLRRNRFETISHLVAQAKTKIAIAFDSFGAAYDQHGPRAYDSLRSRYALFMADIRINRKLAAILAADVVGYSRLMGADEAGTLGALKRHRETIFDPACVSAWNKDPVFGVIGIQSGPRG